MFIKYNGTNVHAIPLVQQRPKRFKNKKTGVVTTRMVTVTDQSPQDVQWLRPGWNEFPKVVWEQNKNHPSIVQMVKKRMIEFLNETVKVKEGKKTVNKIIGQDDEKIDLKLLSPERAVKIVKDTYNRDILQRWLDEDDRFKVKTALRKQIKPLIGEAKEEKDEDEDDDFALDNDDED